MPVITNHSSPSLLSVVMVNEYNGMGVLKGMAPRCRKRLKTTITKLGLLMPYCPGMDGDKDLTRVKQACLDTVLKKMQGQFTEICINKLLERIRGIFFLLREETSGKSVGIILSPFDEQVYYLNFPVAMEVFLGKEINLVELATNIPMPASFFMLAMDEQHVRLYDCDNGKCSKVVEYRGEFLDQNTFTKIDSAIELLNMIERKPVFVTGTELALKQYNQYTDQPLWHFLQLKAIDTISFLTIDELSRNIFRQWKYFYSNYLRHIILESQKKSALIPGAISVLASLSRAVDGILLIGKQFYRKLKLPQSDQVFYPALRNLLLEIEKFILRGNRIVLVENKFIGQMGQIMLLPFDEPASGIKDCAHVEQERSGMLL